MSHSRIPLAALVFPLAMVFALAALPAPAPAGDLTSPSGAPWWRELAQCGGLALAVRDRAVDSHDPPQRIAGLLAYSHSTVQSIDLPASAIEPAPAKKSVHLAAARAWEAFKTSGASLAELEGKLAACAAELAAFRRLP